MRDFEYNCLRKYRHKIEYDPLCSWFTYFFEIYIYFHHSTRKNNIKIPQKCPENHYQLVTNLHIAAAFESTRKCTFKQHEHEPI